MHTKIFSSKMLYFLFQMIRTKRWWIQFSDFKIDLNVCFNISSHQISRRYAKKINEFWISFSSCFRIFKKLVQDYKKNNKIHIHLLFLKFLSVIRYFQFTVPDNNLILHLTFTTSESATEFVIHLVSRRINLKLYFLQFARK